jgi:succinate-acetate transporter protein
MVEKELANPAPLGLAGFALTTTILSLYNAKLLPAAGVSVVVPIAFAYGGLAQMVAGIWEMKSGNTFGYVAFFTYGAFWVAYALLVWSLGAGLLSLGAGSAAGDAIGIFLAMFGVFTFYMWIASFKTNWTLFVVFLLLWITFFVLAIGNFNSSPSTVQAGGYVGILTAISAFYGSAAQVVNSTFGRNVLPLGGKPIKD